jgi:Mg-chelatase subunit ChlD
MKRDHTHITIILDRTGSMESIRDDTIGGFNSFLQEQKKQPGKATLTLVQFDSQDPYEVIHSFAEIKKVPELTRETYVPRASTPLLDALGRGINDLEKRLGAIKKNDRPSKVVMVVITDGQENSSREFRKEHIEKMIKDRQKNSGWQFMFLSADLDSIDDARSVGFRGAAMMVFDKSGKGTSRAWESLSESLACYRDGRAADALFSDQDRKAQEDLLKKKQRSR